MSSQHHDPANITNPEHAEHHIVGPKTYSIIFITLLTLTGITVAAAFVNLGILNPIVALAAHTLSTRGGHQLILFFMHVFYQSKLVKMTVAAGFFTFLILITMTLTDYISRAWGLW